MVCPWNSETVALCFKTEWLFYSSPSIPRTRFQHYLAQWHYSKLQHDRTFIKERHDRPSLHDINDPIPQFPYPKPQLYHFPDNDPLPYVPAHPAHHSINPPNIAGNPHPARLLYAYYPDPTSTPQKQFNHYSFYLRSAIIYVYHHFRLARLAETSELSNAEHSKLDYYTRDDEARFLHITLLQQLLPDYLAAFREFRPSHLDFLGIHCDWERDPPVQPVSLAFKKRESALMTLQWAASASGKQLVAKSSAKKPHKRLASTLTPSPSETPSPQPTSPLLPNPTESMWPPISSFRNITPPNLLPDWDWRYQTLEPSVVQRLYPATYSSKDSRIKKKSKTLVTQSTSSSSTSSSSSSSSASSSSI